VWDAERYHWALGRIREYLAAGDTYQVNLAQPFVAAFSDSACTLFARLACVHPVPYGAYLDCGDFQIVANSPELLLRRRARRLETRPVKGTRPRGGDPGTDAAEANALLASAKDRAEHVMIVDLERNDLGRVCEAGSVAVERLLALESHPTVHHLVSTVSGRVATGVSLAAVLGAVFPGGSITGAPKVRAMEIIAELEPTCRSVYTGAIGYLGFDGAMDTSIVIRTFIVKEGTAYFQVGGGIVVDSDPEREYRETLAKADGLLRALEAHDGAPAR
jgi:para-aminobenzoate synthetase component 1